MIFSAFFLALGFSLRCLTTEPTTATWMINGGQVLIGIGRAVPVSGVSLLAATWFPMGQRATATAIASLCSHLGVAMAFLIGPQIVPEPPNITDSSSPNRIPRLNNLTRAIAFTKQRNDIMRLLHYELVRYWSVHWPRFLSRWFVKWARLEHVLYSLVFLSTGTEAGVAALVFVLVLIYFPARPPRPPSRIAALPRTDIGKGVRSLLGNHRFWILAVAFILPAGTHEAFSGILDIDLYPSGLSQMDVGWLGFYAIIGGCVAGLFVSRMADLFMRRLKVMLLLLFIGAAGSLTWSCLQVMEYVPSNIASTYAATIMSGVFINGAIPLFYEATCEVTYPVAEGVSTGTLTLLRNLVGVFIFALLFVPDIGVVWMKWALLGTVLFAVPLLMALKEHYARIHIDLACIEIDVPEQSA